MRLCGPQDESALCGVRSLGQPPPRNSFLIRTLEQRVPYMPDLWLSSQGGSQEFHWQKCGNYMLGQGLRQVDATNPVCPVIKDHVVVGGVRPQQVVRRKSDLRFAGLPFCQRQGSDGIATRNQPQPWSVESVTYAGRGSGWRSGQVEPAQPRAPRKKAP